MHIKVKRPVRFTLNGKSVSVRPHDAAIKVSDAVGKKLLAEAPDRVKKVKR